MAQGTVYGYRASGNGDITLTLPEGAKVFEIGVTDIVKQVNKYGFATESRARAIDHTLTGEMTGNDVNAYAVKDYDAATAIATLTGVDVVDAETGLVLYRQSEADAAQQAAFQVPLLVPACNIPTDNTDGNLLRPNVEAGALSGSAGTATNYVLANVSQLLNGNDGAPEAVERIGFYKSASGTLAANKAYLQLPGESSQGASRRAVFMAALSPNRAEGAANPYTLEQVLADDGHELDVIEHEDYRKVMMGVAITKELHTNPFAGRDGSMMGYEVDFSLPVPGVQEQGNQGEYDPEKDLEMPVYGGANGVYMYRIWRKVAGQSSEVLLNNESDVSGQSGGSGWGTDYAALKQPLPDEGTITVSDIFMDAATNESHATQVSYTVRSYIFDYTLVALPENSFMPRRKAPAESDMENYDFYVMETTFDLNFSTDPGVTTGVTEVKKDERTDSDVYYNLCGQRIDGRPTQPGIYINAGRKVIVR